MSPNVIHRLLCGIFLLSSYSFAQEYFIKSGLPILTYNVDFSDKTSPIYTEIRTDVNSGLTDLAKEWNTNVTSVDLQVDNKELKGIKFTLPSDPILAAQFLKSFMDKGLKVKTYTVYPSDVECVVQGVPKRLENIYSLCGIRHKIDPCPKIDCAIVNGKPVCSSSSSGTGSSSSESDNDIDTETGRFVVLGYGAAFIALLLIFLVIYCYKKGCANRRKQIKTEEEDAERKKTISDAPIIPNHIYNKSRRF